jgi:L-iditol 2-dehydrogenase
MKAWVLGDPGELTLKQKVPVPGRAGGAKGADRCGRDLRDRSENICSRPAGDDPGGPPFNKNWTPGHEYMGTVVALGQASTSTDRQRVTVGSRRLRPVQALPGR